MASRYDLRHRSSDRSDQDSSLSSRDEDSDLKVTDDTESDDDVPSPARSHGSERHSSRNTSRTSISPSKTPKASPNTSRGSYSRGHTSVDEVDSSFHSSFTVPPVLSPIHTPSPAQRRRPLTKIYTTPEKSSIRKSSTPQRAHQHSSKEVLGIFLVIGVVLVIFICLYLKRGTGLAVVGDESDYFKAFKDGIGSMKQQFPTQGHRFWKVITASVKHILVDPKPEYPAVILLAVPSGYSASTSGSCIARNIIKHVNDIHSKTVIGYIDSMELDRSNVAEEKLHLDRSLQRYLKNGTSKGVVVDHLETLSPSATLLFHGYCDGDNAPFTDVVIVLVYHTGQPLDELNQKGAVEKFLQSTWKSDLDNDKIPALLSRMANNVAIVTEEQASALQAVCN